MRIRLGGMVSRLTMKTSLPSHTPTKTFLQFEVSRPTFTGGGLGTVNAKTLIGNIPRTPIRWGLPKHSGV